MKKYDFLQADTIYKNNSFIDKTSYCNLKAKYTKEYFDKVHKIKINDEQAYAISEPTQNLIVTARAGSGKTRTIACKTIMAIEKENIKPDEILLLSFNRNASEEMRKRICEDFKYNNFDKRTARTFHSLAWDIIQPTEELIYDDGEKEARQTLTKFIWNIYSSKEVFTNEFKNDLYEFLRCKISFSDKAQEIKNIKMILIDEYQDFSKLFFDIINAIKQFNPDLRLFCVGDDWQAINAFAGSDLYFFKEFKNLFTNSDSTSLTHNYRSAKNVVYSGNSLMAGFGVPSKFISKEEGKIELRYIDDTDIRPYVERGFVGIHHRYFIECMDIISKDPKRSYFIMHRESTLANCSELKKFENALAYCCKNKNLKVNFMVDTIHKFKGMEADAVIILETTDNEFPLIHPDSEFNLVFGKTAQMQLDEERRLFYVALTRAKTDIYILTERSNISDYILKIQNYIKK